jgi:hypothetical protein
MTLFTAAPPQLDLGHQQAPQVFLVNGLARNSKRLGDLGPRPACAHRALYLGVLHLVCDRSQRGSRCQAVGRAVER